MSVEDEYFDVLQNIEATIAATYREYPEVCDYDVMHVLEALISAYRAEQSGRTPRESNLSDIEQLMVGRVRKTCEWRRGRETLEFDADDEDETAPQPLSLDEIILCLKKILKSVKKWNKQGGKARLPRFCGAVCLTTQRIVGVDLVIQRSLAVPGGRRIEGAVATLISSLYGTLLA